MSTEQAKQTKPVPLEERLNRMGARYLTKTPGTGERLSTVFQGVGLLAQEDYPLWYLENVLTPKLARCRMGKDGLYEDLVYQAMDMAENTSRRESPVTSRERHDGYELLYELLIAPFCYLETLRTAREGREAEDSVNLDRLDGGDWITAD